MTVTEKDIAAPVVAVFHLLFAVGALEAVITDLVTGGISHGHEPGGITPCGGFHTPQRVAALKSDVVALSAVKVA